MGRNLKLTEGNILKTIIKLSLPIMGTSFIQMAYSLTDIMWLGRLSTEAVAAAGMGGYFLWLGQGLVLISQVGVGVGVAQSYGEDNIKQARTFVENGFRLDILIGLIYAIILFSFRRSLIGFFSTDSIVAYGMAVDYLQILSVGIIFHFINPIFSSILNSSGDSNTPFKVNTIGLVFNMILDPILIFGLGPLPSLGIRGAALATIISQLLVTLTFIYVGKRYKVLYSNIKLIDSLDMKFIKRITRLGTPAFLQTTMHALISMQLTKIVAGFGATAIAVQSVGAQIESLTWMTAEGFSVAMAAFIGQNYGAKKYKRIKTGYRKGMYIIGSIGFLASLLMVFFPATIFNIFIPDDPLALSKGIDYLVILGFSQLFMSLEIGTTGAFNGLGRPLPPSILGIGINLLRVPLALILSSTALGLSGIWWSISSTSIVKGILLVTIYIYLLNKNFKEQAI